MMLLQKTGGGGSWGAGNYGDVKREKGKGDFIDIY